MVNKLGVYGTQSQFDVGNTPGARYVSVSWTDANGNLLLFGGYGYDTASEGYMNDLWKYNISTNQWCWIKGDKRVDQPAVYGTQGLPSALNKSGARTGCVSWTGSNGDLWLFGGYGYDASTSGVLNDLWKISNFVVLPLQLLHFSGVLSNDIAWLQWETLQESGFSHFVVQRSFDGTNFTDIGNINGKGSISKNDYTFVDNDLKTQPGLKAFYRLRLVDNDGRFTYSRILRFDREPTQTILHAFPNPAVHSLNLTFDQNKKGMVMINITDLKGETVIKQAESMNAGRASITLDISALPSAVYIISLVNTSGTMQQKFVKQ